MMAEKARTFKDVKSLTKIMEAEHPREQKKFGRAVKGFDVDKWNKVAKDVVFLANVAKFGQNEELEKILLATEGTTLVEASPHDKVWGIGLAEDDPKAQDRSTWNGTNWLGEILVKVRGALIKDANEKR